MPFVRVMRSVFVFFFFGLLLAAVWFASDLVYSRFVAVPAEESAEERGSVDVLIALNAKLEEILKEHVERAEEEKHRLEARLRSRDLDSAEEEEVRRRLEEMLQRQRELNRELQETRAEEVVFTVETAAHREAFGASGENAVTG